MKKLYVEDILKSTNGIIICGTEKQEIGAVNRDSRNIQKGEAFIAIKGENVDGHKFCKSAIENGATVCLVEDNVFTQEELNEIKDKATIVQVKKVEDALLEIAKIKRSLYDIPVVAITGSVGKTSTKDAIANVMAQKFNVLKTYGNQNNRLGVPLTIMSLKDHDALVIEMGMNHLGEISELTKIAKPTLCVITNIGTSHIGNLGSRENILKAKLEILEGMENGKVIINNDNDLLNKWNKEDKKQEKITFGIKEESKYTAKNIKMNEDESKFTVEINSKEYTFSSNKSGEPFVLNSLSAIAVGMEYGIPITNIQKAISKVELTQNRMDIIKHNDVTIIKDYYNASLESIKPSLEYLCNLKEGKKIAVLGDIKEVGEFAKQIHTAVGIEAAKNKLDILITVGEDAKYIAKSAVENGMKQENVFSYEKNMQATTKLKEIVKAKDKILLKASNSMKFGEILEGFIKI